MNIALPAVTLLLLLLPGILAVQGFLGRIGRKTSDPVGQAGITWPWLVALLLAPMIHLTACALISKLGFPTPSLHAAFVLLSGRFDDADDFARALDAVTGYPWHVAGYFLLVSVLAPAVGWSAQWIVRKSKLDRRFAPLQFASDWHYLFSGELRRELPRPDFVVVAATVEHGGQCFLYLGVLLNYAVERDGGLQRLHLSQALRRPLASDRKPGEAQQMPDQSGRFYPITGDELVIVFRDVHTLNVRYMYAKIAENRSDKAPVT